MSGKNEDLKLLFEKDIKSGDLNGFHAECLTDAWIGRERFVLPLCLCLYHAHTLSLCVYLILIGLCIRWAFIDLTAGPFSWGPAVGGEGVRTDLSLPNVEKTIGAVLGKS